MKTIVAGSREVTDIAEVYKAILASKFYPDAIVSGGARGVDRLGEQVAEEMGCELYVMPADWDKFGKGAGYRRNVDMAQLADSLVAVWDGKSKGTKHMIDIMTKLGKPVYIHLV